MTLDGMFDPLFLRCCARTMMRGDVPLLKLRSCQQYGANHDWHRVVQRFSCYLSVAGLGMVAVP